MRLFSSTAKSIRLVSRSPAKSPTGTSPLRSAGPLIFRTRKPPWQDRSGAGCVYSARRQNRYDWSHARRPNPQLERRPSDLQALSFSGRVNLPGKTDQGQDAFIQLDGKIDTTGLTLAGQIANWNVVPPICRPSHFPDA